MKKTLIVSYTPRIDSNTKKLVDYFIEVNKSKTEITFLDLTKNTPDLLLKDNLNLLLRRNYGGQTIKNIEAKLLLKNDDMLQQILDSDLIVLAYPMYNFSLPAVVKAWVDAIVQAGKTFKMTEVGYESLCEGKQALVLMTTGSDFSIEPVKSRNFATPLIATQLGFIGIPSEHISGFGLQQYSDRVEEILKNAKTEIRALSAKWYL